MTRPSDPIRTTVGRVATGVAGRLAMRTLGTLLTRTGRVEGGALEAGPLPIAPPRACAPALPHKVSPNNATPAK
jgi:hypothetical protein